MRGRFTGCVLLVGLSVLCALWAAQMWSTHRAEWNMARVSYTCVGEESVAAAQMRVLRRLIISSGRGSASAWGQALEATLELQDQSDSLQLDLLAVDGDARLLFNPRMVFGQLPAGTDDFGCALDRVSALKLFGSSDVVGKRVRIDGVEMEVIGVFESPPSDRGLALCPSARVPDVALTALEFALYPGAGETKLEHAKAMLSEAGIGSGGTWDDHGDARALLSWLAALPMALLRFALFVELWWVLCHIARVRLPARFSALGDALFWAGLIALMVLLPDAGRPPASMLPSRWADFAFWPKLLSQWRDAAETLLLGGVSRLRLMELWDMARLIGLALLGSMATIFAWRVVRTLTNGIFGEE